MASLVTASQPGARGSAWQRRSAAGRVVLEAGALAGLVGLAATFRLANVEHYSGSFDEGIRMEQLLLMELGFRPFRDIFASQGPLLLDLLFPFYVLLGKTIGAARLGVSILSLVGLVGAWWSLRPLQPLAGLGAALLLALSPGYLENSRLALAEVPSLAPCLWALGCGLRWQRGGSAAWLYAAAVLGALGVLIKPMAMPIVVPLALLALLRRPLRLGPPLVALAAGVGVTLLVLLALDLPRVLEVLGDYRGGAQGSLGSDAVQNLTLIRTVLLVERSGLLALAGLGVVLGLSCWRATTLALFAWPLAQLGLFLAYTDLADKHVVYLGPPLALLGGLGCGGTAVAISRLRRQRAGLWGLGALVGLGALMLYGSTLPSLWRGDQALLRDDDERVRRDYAGTREQAELMAALTNPGDFVLTDNPLAAFYARRAVPPWLVDTSGTRVDAGSLTSQVAVREAEQFHPKVVVTSRRRLGKLEGFTRWLAGDYRLVKSYQAVDPPLQLYVRTELEDRARAFLAGR